MGRDRESGQCNAYGDVSIHAPAWGATILGLLIRSALKCFNSRARVGRDGMESSTKRDAGSTGAFREPASKDPVCSVVKELMKPKAAGISGNYDIREGAGERP